MSVKPVVKQICKHCKGDIAIRNPTGRCDHLYYPEYCLYCKSERYKLEPTEKL